MNSEEANPWGIVRQYATYRDVLLVDGFWVRENDWKPVDGRVVFEHNKIPSEYPKILTFRTRREAEEFKRRHAPRLPLIYVSRVRHAHK